MAEPSAESPNQIPPPPSGESPVTPERGAFKAFALSRALEGVNYVMDRAWERLTDPNYIQAGQNQMKAEMEALGLNASMIGEMNPETARLLAQRRQEVRQGVKNIVNKIAPLIPDARIAAVAPLAADFIIGGGLALGEQQTHMSMQILQKMPGGKEVVQGIAKVAQPLTQGLGIVK